MSNYWVGSFDSPGSKTGIQLYVLFLLLNTLGCDSPILLGQTSPAQNSPTQTSLVPTAPAQPGGTNSVTQTPVGPNPTGKTPNLPLINGPIPYGNYYIVNINSNKCIDNTGNPTTGTQLTQWDCIPGNSNQMFNIKDYQGTGTYPTGLTQYQITDTNKSTGAVNALTVVNPSNANSAYASSTDTANMDNVSHYPAPAGNQSFPASMFSFNLVDAQNNYYSIVNNSSKKCFSFNNNTGSNSNGATTQNGSLLYESTCLSVSSQYFKFIPITAPSSTFVIRSGSQLTLNGKPFTPTGNNIFWLGLDGDTGAPPSKNRVREAYAIAQAMGANTVRAHTLGVATRQGSQYAILNGERSYNDANFAAIDYAINEARYYGIRLIIPFTDQYHYYHGGKWDFIYFAGAISQSFFQNVGDGTGQYAEGQLFYTNSKVVGDFKDYIAHWLNHTNSLNGIQLKNDPTILAWETGNELGAWNLGNQGASIDPPPPASWTATIAQYIKSIDPNHLVVDGPDGVQTADLSISQVDIYSRHPYGDQSVVPGEYSQVHSSGKVYLIGEFDAHDNLGGFLQTLKSENQGSLWWALFGHNDDCSGYQVHNDGVTMTYPGLKSAEPQLLLDLANFSLQIGGFSPLNSLPNISCQQPELAH